MVAVPDGKKFFCLYFLLSEKNIPNTFESTRWYK